MIKNYSKKTSGNDQLSANFKVREFACKDGSDSILIDDNLVEILQKIRNWANAAVSINSAYRNTAYNKKIGGATNSYHTKGQAADITVSGKTPQEVAKYAESIGAGGIGMYYGTAGKFTHVDTRTKRYFWVNTNGKDVGVSTHGGSEPEAPASNSNASGTESQSSSDKNPYNMPKSNIQKGSTGEGVKWIQWELDQNGAGLDVDGIFGVKTDAAVRDYQKKSGIAVDGIVGKNTRGKLTGSEQNPYTIPSSNIKKGNTGEGVKWIQWELDQEGAGLNIDGIFGVKTDAAVRDFQKKSGLAVDGIVGPDTRGKLK